MKKWFVVFVALVLLVTMTAACAEDLGIRIIGGEEMTAAEDEPILTLEDLQLNAIYTVNDDTLAVPLEFLVVDCFAQLNKDEGDHTYTRPDIYATGETDSTIVYSYANAHFSDADWRYAHAKWHDSGSGAQYVWLRMDMTNINSDVANLTDKLSVKVVYRNEYEFAGWVRQIDYNKINKNYSNGLARYGHNVSMFPAQIVTHPDNAPQVGFMGTGNYVFGCTLPNYVIEDETAPLCIVIQVGDEELTYHIRK